MIVWDCLHLEDGKALFDSSKFAVWDSPERAWHGLATESVVAAAKDHTMPPSGEHVDVGCLGR